MITKRLGTSLVALFLLIPSTAWTQEGPPADTTIVFTPSRAHLLGSEESAITTHAWGIDLMLSNNGFGLGGFFRNRLTADLSWFASLAVSDVKDDQEVEYYDIYGRSYSPYKKNRLLLVPLFAGVEYRLFREEIADNFRPYVSAAVGPAMMVIAPYQRTVTTDFGGGQSMTEYQQIEFFESLKYATTQYTLGGYIGAGAYFGSESGTLSGISVRYYFIPFQEGIETLEGVYVNNFGGLYITLNFGTSF
jgi:hypothetical protein